MVFGAIEGQAPPSSGHCSCERSSSGLEAPSTPPPPVATMRRKSSLRVRATPMDLVDDSDSNNAQPDLSDVEGEQSCIGSIVRRSEDFDDAQAQRPSGCCRAHDMPRCAIADQVVQWPTTSGRGTWCRECYTCWRTHHRGARPIGLARGLIKHTPIYHTWDESWIAYVSLRVDGSERITSPMVSHVVKLINGFATSVGWHRAPPYRERWPSGA
jgi:hypothetical protein